MTYDVYCEYLNPYLKSERMKNRQIFYATLLGKEGDVTVEELAAKSGEKMALTQVSETLDKLAKAQILPNARSFTSEESKAVEMVLNAYAEKDSTVTSELAYFAVQSQVLCKLSYE